MSGPLLTVQDVAALVGLSDYTVRQAIRDGELPAIRLRHRLRVDPDDLAAWVHEARTTARSTRVQVQAPAGIGRPPATPDNVRDLISRQRRGKAA